MTGIATDIAEAKLDWHMGGTISYRDGGLQGIDGVWPGLTFAEANAQAEAAVKEIMGRRKVHGVSLSAQAQTGNGRAIISLAQWK